MKKLEFHALPSEVVSLANKIVKEEITQTQFEYLVQSKKIDEDQLYDAVDHINNEINKGILFFGLLTIFMTLSVFGILGTLSI